MPITEEGIVINMVQGTESIAKRETYGQIIELYNSQRILQSTMKKRKIQMEICPDQTIEPMIDELRKVELPKLYNPHKNEFFNCPEVISGTMTYTVQKHLVDEKIRVRSDDGKCDAISKQPPQGKKSNGGLKIGDMERNALSASGAINLLKNFYGIDSS